METMIETAAGVAIMKDVMGINLKGKKKRRRR